MINSIIGHTDYIIFLLLLTGAGILFIDVKGYAGKQMKKEEKTGRFLGWMNVSLGVAVWVMNWFVGM